MNNSFFEVYSLIGYIFAIFGIFYIFYFREIKKYFIFILWPLSVLLSIIVFKITGISYLSPYQRNLYYFVLSLPILSSLGVYFVFNLIKEAINKTNLNINKKIWSYIAFLLFFLLIIAASFIFYLDMPGRIQLSKMMGMENYKTIKYLSDLPNAYNSKIIAPIGISTALFPVSGLEPVATVYFRGDQTEIINFFNTKNCSKQEILIKKYNVSYILSNHAIDCNWTLVYNKTDYIYKYNNKF